MRYSGENGGYCTLFLNNLYSVTKLSIYSISILLNYTTLELNFMCLKSFYFHQLHSNCYIQKQAVTIIDIIWIITDA